ncbi:hypothetical protein V5F59_14585 [Xanthobacter autotrophicus DSM 431]|uniref:hypothetical protein n=1 Tax=Xanthobacter nonsaccharivorans TaxID=3119912 RepID=UPI0037292C92
MLVHQAGAVALIRLEGISEMGAVSAAELAKIVYLDPRAVDGRSLLMMPLWDGFTWHLWTEAPPGSIIKLQVVDAIHSNYVAKQPAHETDIWIEFVDHMWQRASWPEVSQIILGIQDDFHLLATSVAKLRHFFDTRDKIGQTLISSFVKTELEYLITVARSVFDLLQEALAAIWNNRVNLLDAAQEAIRKRHKLPDKFTKMAIQGRETARPIEELTGQYAIPPVLAEQYHRFAPFYVSLLKARDKIIHGGGSVETIFVTEKGFCVDRNAKTFADFEWKPDHNYNDTLVSLLPWVAHVVFGTIQACNHVMGAFASVISMPPEIAPGYHVFIRDPANGALSQLANAVNGNLVWWSDTMPSS